MLDVSRYRHDGSYASGRPSIYVVFGLEGFKRALEDLKNLWVRMAVQRNDHSRGQRAANKANFLPISSGEARNSISVMSGVIRCLRSSRRWSFSVCNSDILNNPLVRDFCAADK